MSAKSIAVTAHEAKMAALLALEDRAGRITPDRLVHAAKSPLNVWHKSFQWDNVKAGHQHRIDVAREIIRTWVPARVISETVQRRSVVYVRDPRCGNKKQGYVNIAKVRSDEDLRREVLIAEFQRAASALQRAYDIADILNARSEVQELIVKVNLLRERGESARIVSQ